MVLSALHFIVRCSVYYTESLKLKSVEQLVLICTHNSPSITLQHKNLLDHGQICHFRCVSTSIMMTDHFSECVLNF